MIDERELYALGERGKGPVIPHRPLEAVLARGTRLRRRRQAVRAVGASTVVAGLLGSGLLVRARSGGEADVRAAEDPTTTDRDESTPPPPPPPDCEVERFYAGDQIPTSEVPAEMRVLPGSVPGDPPITYAAGQRYTNPCPDTAPYPADSALEMKADDGDGIAEAVIRLSGPLPRPESDTVGMSRGPTELRGGAATLVQPGGSTDNVAFAWTEPDGWSWSIIGVNVDEATLRAATEALVLDSSPENDDPTASLAPADLPAGFRVTWQTLGTPKPVVPQTMSWNVSFGTTGAGETGMRCELQVSQYASDIPLGNDGSIATEHVTVNGEDALWNPVGGSGYLGLGSLTWMVAPDVVATMGCLDQSIGTGGEGSVGVDAMIPVAESVVPVAADDPRLPA